MDKDLAEENEFFVALLVSAWIEIRRTKLDLLRNPVALLVSAWIEIWCLPNCASGTFVALLVSAWIEISYKNDELGFITSHSL